MNRIGLLGLIVGAVFLGGCATAPGTGKVQQVEISGDDIGNLLGAYVGKFEYTLPEGNYDTDIWLEQLDADTTTPKRLTFGKGADDSLSDGGIILVCLSDPATTTTEKGETWKLTIASTESKGGKVSKFSSLGTYLLKNPLKGLPGGEQDGIRMSSELKHERSIELRKEVTLMEWAGGPPTESIRGGIVNFRYVRLKMKIVPHGELMPE